LPDVDIIDLGLSKYFVENQKGFSDILLDTTKNPFFVEKPKDILLHAMLIQTAKQPTLFHQTL